MTKDSVSVILNNSPENLNLELLQNLRKATEGLVYLTESDAPYEIYLWETTKLGELNFETLLNTFGYLRELNSKEFDEFINSDLSNLKHLQLISNKRESVYYGSVNIERQVIENFRNILSQINPYLTNIKILRLMDFYILISNTPSGGLLGISTDFNFEDYFYDYREDRELCLGDLAAEDRQ
ncbi:MAG: nuclease A inhibitor family protein, partial [Prochloraceae cyanobacterium]